MVVIVIVAILSAIAFTASKRAITSAHTATCLSNLRQMAIIASTAATDNGFFPPSLSQTASSSGKSNNGNHFYSHITTEECASCPAAKFTGNNPKNGKIITAYGANPTVMPHYVVREDGSKTNPLVRPSQIRRPSEVFLLSDGAQFASNPRALAFSARWYGKQTGLEANKDKPLTTAEVPDSGFWDDVSTIPFRHDGKANVVFVDGHAETIKRLEDLKQKNLYWNY